MANQHLTKRCPKCETFKPPEAFGRNAARRDGLNSQCKECRKGYHAQYYQENREKMDAINRDWYRRNPEVRAAVVLRNYHKNPKPHNARSRDYHRRNPEKVADNAKRYKEDNPERIRALKMKRKERIRKLPGSHTGEDIKRILRDQRGRCAYGCELVDGKFHIDHITPASKEGATNAPSGIQILCVPCNLRKKDKDPLDFARELGLLL